MSSIRTPNAKVTMKPKTKAKSATATATALAPVTPAANTASRVLGEEGFKDLRTAFQLLDKNSDGQISIPEFQEMLKKFGIVVPETHIIRIVEGASSNDGLCLTEEDFLNWISPFLENDENPDEDLMAAFQVFDKDGNGYITRDELKQAMELIGEAVSENDLNEMLAIADVDLDGKIDYGEFARLLT